MFGKLLVNASLAGCIIAVAASGSTPANSADKQLSHPRMDLAFCIDTTGSMQSELDVVKTKMKELVAKLSGTKPAPDIRVGLVAFRDRGDEYVTKVFPFSDDVDKVVKDIANLQATGGGDGPEAVNQALHSAINDLKWTADKTSAKLLFLIGDAPPHPYPGDFSWRTESKAAIAKGIQINTLACAGLEGYAQAEGIDVFKQIAKLTDGTYEIITYRQEVVSSDGHRETLITSAGATYKVKDDDKEAWKAGVASLSSRGLVEKAERRSYGRGGGSWGGMPAAASAGMMPGAHSTVMEAEAGITSRADSNLDAVLLQGAKKSLEKVRVTKPDR